MWGNVEFNQRDFRDIWAVAPVRKIRSLNLNGNAQTLKDAYDISQISVKFAIFI